MSPNIFNYISIYYITWCGTKSTLLFLAIPPVLIAQKDWTHKTQKLSLQGDLELARGVNFKGLGSGGASMGQTS